eukprot:scaffold140731_cov15-Tisochrysis_lutea.AAC.1
MFKTPVWGGGSCPALPYTRSCGHRSIHGQTANDVRSGRGSSTPIWASPRSPAQPLLPQDEPERLANFDRVFTVSQRGWLI